jgi:glycerophosphoryl diester phosphodiesterase
MHDETVDRLTDGTGLVKEMTLAEVQALDAAWDWSPRDDGAEFPYRGQGVRVPTLAELFAAFPQMPMNIEIKQAEPSISRALCEEIVQAGMTRRVLVASFRQATLEEFRTICPDVATSLGEDEVRDFYFRNLVRFGASFSPQGVAVQVPIERSGRTILTPRFVRSAQARGMDVHAWTINDEAEMQALIDMGVDGIITDAPTLLLELLGRGAQP